MTRAPKATQRGRERVLLCGAIFPGQPEESDGPLSEARGLAQAAETEVLERSVVQKRETPDPATLLGKGKVAEIAELVREDQPDAVVVDNDLSPGQIRNLEKAFGVRVVDRSELILDIFARRAQTRQAKLQVELAQTEYLMPRLRRMWTHLERFEGGIGMRGPGETQLETDKRLLRKRIQMLRSELAEIEERSRRQVRTRASQFTLGLVGYTNAGKSTLLNALTGSSEFAADMLFATLDTRTRAWKLPDGRTVLVSDTVGFLQRLPHHLVASFHATLEEALEVDLLLHVVDASHTDALNQLRAVEQVLREAGRVRPADVLVFNKIDRIPDLESSELWRAGQATDVVCISARTRQGLDRLTEIVTARLDARCALVEMLVPYDQGRLLSQLRMLGPIAHEHARDDGVELRLRVPEDAMGLIRQAAAHGVEHRVIEAAREPWLAETESV